MSGAFKACLFLTIMIFFHQATWIPTGKEFTNVARWVALGTLCLFALSAPGGETKGAPTRLKAMALAFATVAIFSSAWSRVLPMYTLQRGLSVLLLAVFLSFVVWPRLRKPADYAAVMKVIVMSAWVMMLVSMAMWLGRVGESVRWPTGAVQGAFGNPNSLGMVSAIIIPVTLGYFHYKKSILTLALLAMSVVLLLLCQSRAGLMGTVVGILAFYAGFYGRKLWIGVLVMLLLMMGALVFRDLGRAGDSRARTAAFQETLMRGETDASEYGSGRIPLWTGALEKWKERPFLGYGFGTAGDTYYGGTRVPARFHSSLVQITTELGLVGVFFFAAPLFYSVARAVHKRALPSLDRPSRAVVAALAAGWFGGVTNSLFESWLFSVGNVPTLLVWLCFFAAMKGMSMDSTAEADVS